MSQISLRGCFCPQCGQTALDSIFLPVLVLEPLLSLERLSASRFLTIDGNSDRLVRFSPAPLVSGPRGRQLAAVHLQDAFGLQQQRPR